MNTHIESARRTFRIEIDALSSTVSALDEKAFSTACELLLACKGRVVVSGIGKSGHIARKIASTLTSTGTPSLFLHPAEAAHGDIGLLQSGDSLIILSKSGESDEIYPLLRAATERHIPIIAITSNGNSELAKAATAQGALLLVSVNEEACPHDLAPTSSTTAQLVIGDALAVALLEARKFTSDDFARLHPGGALGRKLTMTVRDLMKTGNELPLIKQDATLSSVMLEISGKRLGCACVVDTNNILLGIITDGDLRRCFQRDGEINLKQITAGDLMSGTPKTTDAETLAIEALHQMEEPLPKVMQLPVLDKAKKVIGLIHLHDIVKAGIQ